MVKAVLFDLDNTLTNRTASVTAFAGKFYNDFKKDLNPNTPFTEVLEVILAGDGGGYIPKTQMFRAIRMQLAWRIKPSEKTLSDYWYAQSPKTVQVRDGMLDTLKTLKQRGYKLGIITNGPTDGQNATINAIGVRGLMDVIVVSEAVGVRKPDARIFQMALNQLGIAPQDAVFVGDNPTADIQGAKQAGLKAVWMSDGQGKSIGNATISKLAEVLTLV